MGLSLFPCAQLAFQTQKLKCTLPIVQLFLALSSKRSSYILDPGSLVHTLQMFSSTLLSFQSFSWDFQDMVRYRVLFSILRIVLLVPSLRIPCFPLDLDKLPLFTNKVWNIIFCF